MMLDFCLRFPGCINELLKRVTGKSYRYFTNPVASYYLQATLGDVEVSFCNLAKLPKPSSGCLTKKQWNELRQWTQQYSRGVRQPEYHKELFNERQARNLAIEPLRVCTSRITFS